MAACVAVECGEETVQFGVEQVASLPLLQLAVQQRLGVVITEESDVLLHTGEQWATCSSALYMRQLDVRDKVVQGRAQTPQRLLWARQLLLLRPPLRRLQQNQLPHWQSAAGGALPRCGYRAEWHQRRQVAVGPHAGAALGRGPWLKHSLTNWGTPLLERDGFRVVPHLPVSPLAEDGYEGLVWRYMVAGNSSAQVPSLLSNAASAMRSSAEGLPRNHQTVLFRTERASLRRDMWFLQQHRGAPSWLLYDTSPTSRGVPQAEARHVGHFTLTWLCMATWQLCRYMVLRRGSSD
eukprot:gene3287-7546_t